MYVAACVLLACMQRFVVWYRANGALPGGLVTLRRAAARRPCAAS